MLAHTAIWRWDEVRLSPLSWREPRSGWELDDILNLVASLSGGLSDIDSAMALTDRILPKWSLLEMDRLEMDADGALRPRDTTRIDGELLAWVVESLWGRPGTLDELLSGWTLARVREDGAIGQVCVPLISESPGIALIACSLSGDGRDHVLSLASRMTWLTSLAPRAVTSIQGDSHSGPLTERQWVILRAMAKGLTNRQIASRINFSESTVRMESMAIYRTYGVHSRADAVAAARAAGHLDESGRASLAP